MVDLNEDADNLFDKREELNDIASEKNRIKWLFSNYVNIRTDEKNALSHACVELLNSCGKRSSQKVAEDLYQVRCLLVHKLYILNDAGRVILQRLNHLFLDVLIDIILSFDASRVDMES